MTWLAARWKASSRIQGRGSDSNKCHSSSRHGFVSPSPPSGAAPTTHSLRDPIPSPQQSRTGESPEPEPHFPGITPGGGSRPGGSLRLEPAWTVWLWGANCWPRSLLDHPHPMQRCRTLGPLPPGPDPRSVRTQSPERLPEAPWTGPLGSPRSRSRVLPESPGELAF